MKKSQHQKLRNKILKRVIDYPCASYTAFWWIKALEWSLKNPDKVKGELERCKLYG
jgi:hypothetical protein